MNTLWIIDSCLRDYRGHYYNYAESLHDAAIAAGLHCRVISHREAIPQVRARLRAEPVFRHDLHHTFRNPFAPFAHIGRGLRWLAWGLQLWQTNRTFFRDLCKSSLAQATRDDVVFSPMCDHRQLIAWAWWFRQRSANSVPYGRLMLRFESLGRPTHFALEALRKAAPAGRVRLATDSLRLRDDYSFVRLPMDLLPIPHTRTSVGLEAKGFSIAPVQRPIRFITVGDLRWEKGYSVIVDALEIVSRRSTPPGREFILQCTWPSGRPVPPELAALRQLAGSTVKVMETSMDYERYYRFLRESDVVLLPYRQTAYRARTSGVLVEAMTLAKPVIVTANTWLSDQTAMFGSGLTFPDGDGTELARTIEGCARELVTLQRRAVEAQVRVAAFHNAENCLKAILSGFSRETTG